MAAAAGPRPPRRCVAVSLTVGKLKLLVERLLGVPAPRQVLRLRQAAAPGGGAEGPSSTEEDITGEDGRELRFFSLADGARIEVEEVDPGERAAAAAGAATARSSAQERRMEAAERALQGLLSEQQRLMAGAGR